MIDQIYQWDKFLTDEEYSAVWEQFEKYNWEHKGGEKQHRPIIPIRTFWFKQLLDSTMIESLFKSKIESFLNTKIETSQLYGNGQAHSQSAWVHRDRSDDEGSYGSLVYYLHKNWKPEFGGHLIFINEDEPTKVDVSLFPHSNSAVLFNSKLKHMALEPTVYCEDQRISIAYKFKVIE